LYFDLQYTRSQLALINVTPPPLPHTHTHTYAAYFREIKVHKAPRELLEHQEKKDSPVPGDSLASLVKMERL